MTDKGVVKQLEVLLEPIKKNIGIVRKDLAVINKKLVVLDKKLVVLDKKLEEIDESHGKKLNQHTESLVNIESTINIYGDMYDINNGNVRKLEKRIDVLEDKNGVMAPPELRLTNL